MDYESLGLKAGLEIHQQLDTKHKLFCSCPTAIRDDKADVVVKRKLRASAGETGEMDVAAAYEQLRGKHFTYHGYSDTTCTVELDEEPVHDLDTEALAIALQVSLMLKSKPVDRIQVMRKTVIDGSNTSGFQRTALIARNGSIEISGKETTIATVCVEEESARVVERTTASDTYNLSRLGIPLVEIATGADMRSPEGVKQVAEYLGMVLRSTGKVKRGLGTIRQDVNVSIARGARVEIKGAQELHLIPKLVWYEALRQKALADAAEELRRRQATLDGKIVDVTKMLSSCASGIIKDATEKGGVILAAKLAGFKGIIGREFEGVPGRRLGKEFSECAKAYSGVGGVLHTDELPKYGITAADVTAINKALGCNGNDAFVLVAAPREAATLGVQAVVGRARQATRGVPSEVRKANEDGTTTFLRPMPGSARMYPETDVPLVNPVPILKNIKLPKLLIEKVADYEKLGLSAELARAVLNSDHALLFEELAPACSNLTPSYIADTLLSYHKSLLANSISESATERVTERHLRDVLTGVNSGKLAKESVIPALSEAAKTGKIDMAKHRVMSDAELTAEIKAVIAAHQGMPLNALIGKAMEKLRGKAPGNAIVEKIKKLHK